LNFWFFFSSNSLFFSSSFSSSLDSFSEKLILSFFFDLFSISFRSEPEDDSESEYSFVGVFFFLTFCDEVEDVFLFFKLSLFNSFFFFSFFFSALSSNILLSYFTLFTQYSEIFLFINLINMFKFNPK
jgi:hypothetical protein